LFAKVSELDWVKEVKPTAPSRKNGWGKHETDYHLENNYAIEIHVRGADGKDQLLSKWKWADQKEAGQKSVPKKHWNGFLEAVKKADLA